MRIKTALGSLLLLIGLCGCATSSDSQPAASLAHDNVDALLWLQTSTEYAAATTGIYAAATRVLEKMAKAEPERVSRMAVVLDIDETVLDNSRYQGQLVFDNTRYNGDTWDDWIELRDATAVPGVVDFIEKSQSLGAHVAFITNRRCRARPDIADECPQVEDTLANLRDVGIDTSSSTLYIRADRPPAECRQFLSAAEQEDGTWSGDKTSRRDCIGSDYDIVLLFGDQLGDFTEVDRESSRELANDYAEHWGKTWFMLPNPTYGDWRPNDSAEKRERIRGVEQEDIYE